MTKVFVHPAHVVEKLSQGPVSTSSELQLDDDEMLGRIDRQNVNPSVVDRELHSRPAILIIEGQTLFDACEILCQKIAQVGLSGKLLIRFIVTLIWRRSLALQELVIPLLDAQVSIALFQTARRVPERPELGLEF